MKILKKLKLIIISFILIIKSMFVKVYAISSDRININAVCEYGVIDPHPSVTLISSILSTTIVPLVLLIGIVVFFIKSTSSILKKILISIGIIILYIVFRIIRNNI